MVDYTIRRFHEYTDDELVQMLQRLAAERNITFVASRLFEQSTGVSEATVINHFGSWRTFCDRAGLKPRYVRAPSRDELFANLEEVWTRFGRQPRAKEMKQPDSPISISQYSKTFRKPWFGICVDFLAWRSGLTPAEIVRQAKPSPVIEHEEQERREISLSLRYKVLHRDNFRCVVCGRSPATHPGCQLHVDHITPWSKGGKTILENLRCTCADCNIGRGNRFGQ